LMRQGDEWEIALKPELAYDGEPAVEAKIRAERHVIIVELTVLQVREASWITLPGDGSLAGAIPHFLRIFSPVILGLFVWGTCKLCSGSHILPENASAPDNPRVYFDINIGSEPAGRIEMELFKNLCPKAAENFRCLCTGEKGKGRHNKPLHFKGTSFHNITKGFKIHGGDITGQGSANESVFGGYLEDEWDKGIIYHSRRGLLSMANYGQHKNGSEFFIMLAGASQLNRNNVVFGQVVQGDDILKKIEAVGWNKKYSGSPPQAHVSIEACGESRSKSD